MASLLTPAAQPKTLICYECNQPLKNGDQFQEVSRSDGLKYRHSKKTGGCPKKVETVAAPVISGSASVSKDQNAEIRANITRNFVIETAFQASAMASAAVALSRQEEVAAGSTTSAPAPKKADPYRTLVVINPAAEGASNILDEERMKEVVAKISEAHEVPVITPVKTHRSSCCKVALFVLSNLLTVGALATAYFAGKYNYI